MYNNRLQTDQLVILFFNFAKFLLLNLGDLFFRFLPSIFFRDKEKQSRIYDTNTDDADMDVDVAATNLQRIGKKVN